MVITKAVTQENKELAKKEAERLGWKLHNIRMLSNHVDDDYLMVTLCEIPDKKEWVTSIFNSTRGGGFFEGQYVKDKKMAIDYFYSKR